MGDWIAELEQRNPRARSVLRALEEHAERQHRRREPLPKAPRVAGARKVEREWPLEADEQKAAVRELRRRGVRVVAASNGAHIAGGKEDRQRKVGQLKAMGMATGFPDLHILTSRGHLFIEMKRQRGCYGTPAAQARAVRPEQREWLDALAGMGQACCVAYGAAEALAAYESFMAHGSLPDGVQWGTEAA